MQRQTEIANYTAEELSVILNIQNVLLESRGTVDKYLKLPNVSRPNSDLQKGLYAILESYQHRVSMPDWTGVYFLNYSFEQLALIKSYFSRFNQALQITARETPKLSQSAIGRLQLTLIESCLKGNLDKMAIDLKDTPWSQSIINLSFETTMQQIQSIPNPVTGCRNGQVSLNLHISNPSLNMIAQLTKENVKQAANIVDLERLTRTVEVQNQSLDKQLIEIRQLLMEQNQLLKKQNQQLEKQNQESVELKQEFKIQNQQVTEKLQTLDATDPTQARIIQDSIQILSQFGQRHTFFSADEGAASPELDSMRYTV
ncbi:MAG: hypothetical protein Q8R24_07365 [Legionellaceae bacterium]|nr:hypothetical protein [Legionellaceae bacterium]